MDRVPTGSTYLDTCLDGGLPSGSILLVKGEPGAGATEFAMNLLRETGRRQPTCVGRFATAMRSKSRVEREVGSLFANKAVAESIEVAPIEDARLWASNACAGLRRGDVVAVESAATISRKVGEPPFLDALRILGDQASDAGVTVLLLHATGSLPASFEREVAGALDGVLDFAWLESGPHRRRTLTLQGLRGLAPMLEGDQVPILEVNLQQGAVFQVSRIKSVV